LILIAHRATKSTILHYYMITPFEDDHSFFTT